MSDDPRLTALMQSNVRELRQLRATANSQQETIRLLKSQYEDLAADYDALLSDSQTKLHKAYTERDRAQTAESEINTILTSVATNITEALRARKGDEPRPDQVAQPKQLPPNSTVAPLHQPQNHPALRRAIEEDGRGPSAA